MESSNDIKMVNSRENIFGDDIAFVEEWDFSRANLSQEHRIQAITQVASICYQSPKALGSEVLYNRLVKESIGLPSSSFEFVPVLLDNNDPVISHMINRSKHIAEHSDIVSDRYLLTNYRAICYEYENNKEHWDTSSIDPRDIFNTEEECEVIKNYFKVFLFKTDIPTRTQMIRHRTSWQELSRRYVSGTRVEFEFYLSDRMKDVTSTCPGMLTLKTDDIFKLCISHYKAAIEAGVKPEEARRIIPQAAYTQFWGAFTPKYLHNFFKLRLDSHAQVEIRKVATAMNEMVN